MKYLNHTESKFEGDVDILKRKHVNVIRLIHIGKESNNLDETEVLGVNSDNYEIYKDLESLDSKFMKISRDILKLNPKDVKRSGISRQTLWNVKKMIRLNQINRISISIKIKFLKKM